MVYMSKHGGTLYSDMQGLRGERNEGGYGEGANGSGSDLPAPDAASESFTNMLMGAALSGGVPGVNAVTVLETITSHVSPDADVSGSGELKILHSVDEKHSRDDIPITESLDRLEEIRSMYEHYKAEYGETYAEQAVNYVFGTHFR